MLCGCGVAFKMIQALTDEEEFKKSMFDYLEIVTLATICDIVPLVDENRIIVKNGLKLMKEGKNIGLRELIKVLSLIHILKKLVKLVIRYLKILLTI